MSLAPDPLDVFLSYLLNYRSNQYKIHLGILNYKHNTYLSRFRMSTGGLRHAVATLQRGEGGEAGIRTLGTREGSTS